MKTTILNETARVVLDALTLRARAATEEQLQRLLDLRCRRKVAVQSVARRLRLARLLEGRRLSIAFPVPARPLAVWRAGQTAPDFEAIAYILEKRWQTLTAIRTTVWWATRPAARLLGGTACHLQHHGQLEHDLGTTSVFVRFHETDPDVAEQWIAEDILRRDYAPSDPRLAKMPDGAIVFDDSLVRLIEFGGQYSARRLRRLHEHCRKYDLPYELW